MYWANKKKSSLKVKMHSDSKMPPSLANAATSPSPFQPVLKHEIASSLKHTIHFFLITSHVQSMQLILSTLHICMYVCMYVRMHGVFNCCQYQRIRGGQVMASGHREDNV